MSALKHDAVIGDEEDDDEKVALATTKEDSPPGLDLDAPPGLEPDGTSIEKDMVSLLRAIRRIL